MADPDKSALAKMMNWETRLKKEFKAVDDWQSDYSKLFKIESNEEKVARLEKELSSLQSACLETSNSKYGKCYVEGFQNLLPTKYNLKSDRKLGNHTSNCF